MIRYDRLLFNYHGLIHQASTGLLGSTEGMGTKRYGVERIKDTALLV